MVLQATKHVDPSSTCLTRDSCSFSYNQISCLQSLTPDARSLTLVRQALWAIHDVDTRQPRSGDLRAHTHSRLYSALLLHCAALALAADDDNIQLSSEEYCGIKSYLFNLRHVVTRMHAPLNAVRWRPPRSAMLTLALSPSSNSHTVLFFVVSETCLQMKQRLRCESFITMSGHCGLHERGLYSSPFPHTRAPSAVHSPPATPRRSLKIKTHTHS